MLPIILQAWRQKAESPAVKRVKGALRVGAWLSVAGAVVFGVMSRSAHADVKKGSLMFGRELTQIVNDDGVSDTIHLKMNGQSIHMKQDIQPRTVHEIISEYEAFCRKNPSPLAEIWSQGPYNVPGSPVPVMAPAGMEAGIVKSESDSEGVLICIAKGKKSEKGLAESLSAFDETGDLGVIGRLRYVYAKSSGKVGASAKVVAVWTDDSFNLGEILLEDGREAPGTDTQLPKPEGARRVVNAEVVGTPYGVRVFEIKQQKDEVATFYDAWAKKNEFRALAPDIDPSQRLRGYFRGGSQVMVGVFTNPDGKTYLSIAELWPKNGHAAEKVAE